MQGGEAILQCWDNLARWVGWGSGWEWCWQRDRVGPGEGYHRANGERSSNELSWEENTSVSVTLSLPTVRVR